MKAHILVVDDDTRITDLLRRILAYEGYSVTIAASGTATVTFKHVFDSAGSYTIGVGDQSTTASVVAAPGPDNTLAYALGGGLLVVGLAIGAVVGIMMSRRRKRPPTMAKEDESKLADEELPPEENL